MKVAMPEMTAQQTHTHTQDTNNAALPILPLPPFPPALPAPHMPPPHAMPTPPASHVPPPHAPSTPLTWQMPPAPTQEVSIMSEVPYAHISAPANSTDFNFASNSIIGSIELNSDSEFNFNSSENENYDLILLNELESNDQKYESFVFSDFYNSNF